MNEEPLRQDADFDRAFGAGMPVANCRKPSKRSKMGRILFGNRERLFLSAALDHFRDRNFQQSARSAQRIFTERQRQPFTGCAH
jgi:hypothetical protein